MSDSEEAAGSLAFMYGGGAGNNNGGRSLAHALKKPESSVVTAADSASQAHSLGIRHQRMSRQTTSLVSPRSSVQSRASKKMERNPVHATVFSTTDEEGVKEVRADAVGVDSVQKKTALVEEPRVITFDAAAVPK